MTLRQEVFTPYFNEEELSRILSAHAGGQMKRFNIVDSLQCCVFMAAECDEQIYLNDPKWDIALAFDSEYDSKWSAEEFIHWLSEKGLA